MVVLRARAIASLNHRAVVHLWRIHDVIVVDLIKICRCTLVSKSFVLRGSGSLCLMWKDEEKSIGRCSFDVQEQTDERNQQTAKG